MSRPGDLLHSGPERRTDRVVPRHRPPVTPRGRGRLAVEPRRLLVAGFVLAGGVVSILVMGILAVVTGEPFIFPSLGPTAYILLAAPLAPEASPRNTIAGHLAAVLCGYLALAVFGLTAAGPVSPNSISLPRASAAALSLGLTSALMVRFRFSHPPAGATTLIVSLGLLTRPGHLAILMLGVILLLAVARVVNLVAELTGIEEAVVEEEEERAEEPGFDEESEGLDAT